MCYQFSTPDAPDKVEVDDVDEDSITLTWQKPKDDGGDRVTGYVVEVREPGSSKWKPANDFPIRDTFFTGENWFETYHSKLRVIRIPRDLNNNSDYAKIRITRRKLHWFCSIRSKICSDYAIIRIQRSSL